MEGLRRSTTVRQLELLIEFLEGHRDLALGRVRSKEARAVAVRLWRECAEILNSEGPARTEKEWSKVWNDHKCRVRAKLVSINASQRATGGGPSNAPTLTNLEERVANILGRDIGPLPNVRQEQFTSNNNDGDVVVDLLAGEEQLVDLPDIQIASAETVYEADLEDLQAAVSQRDNQVQPPQPASPVPDLTGQAPSPQYSPRRTAGRVRRVRGRRGMEHTPRGTTATAPTQATRNALEESRFMILHIEEMRAEAALANAQANNSFATSFRLIAESIDRLSQKFCRPQSPS